MTQTNNGYSTLDEIILSAKNGQSTKQFMYNSLLTSRVFVICTPAAKKQGLYHDGKLEVFAERSSEGVPTVPVFTSVKLLNDYAPVKVEAYEINCLELFRLINGAAAIINPGQVAKPVPAAELSNLIEEADRPTKPWQFPFDTSDDTVYSTPSRAPEALKKLLVPYFQKNDNVEKAYIIGMTPKDGAEKLLLIIESAGSYRKLFTELSHQISKAFGNTDVLFISYETPEVQRVADSFTAFYIKTSKLKSDHMVF